MPFITQGKTNWKFLLIVIILAIIVGGVALWYVKRPEKPYQPVEIKKPYIKVISPNGGETLEFYGINEIKWESSGVDAVNIILIDEATGWECERRTDFIPASVGRIDWEPIPVVCGPSGDKFKIKMISADGKISDESDGYFSMIEGDIQKHIERSGKTQEEGIIKVIWPKGGEILERGKTYSFEFFCGEIPERIPITYIVLEKGFKEYCLEKSGLSSCAMNLGNTNSLNGIFCEPGQRLITEWTIPLDVIPGEKEFKISIYGGGPKAFFISYSDDYFSVTEFQEGKEEITITSVNFSCDTKNEETGWDICKTENNQFEFQKPNDFFWIKNISVIPNCQYNTFQEKCPRFDDLILAFEKEHGCNESCLKAWSSNLSSWGTWSRAVIGETPFCVYKTCDCGAGSCGCEFFHTAIRGKDCYIIHSLYSRVNCSTAFGIGTADYAKCEEGQNKDDKTFEDIISTFKFLQ